MALTKKNDVNTGYSNESLLVPSRPQKTHTMTISAEVQQFIIESLTDMYSNPIEATVRETVSNATDATIKARRMGQDAPDVEIIRPSIMAPVLEVIDHGTGMDRGELDTFFSDYGNSSKSMDMTAIGSKGLGAKAMLAYSPKATVDTVKDGHRIVISMERGETANTTRTILEEDVTTPNGTTVKIPVRNKDVDAMNDAIDRYARYTPETAPITVDGDKVSISSSYTLLKQVQIGVDNDGSPIMGNLWVNISQYGNNPGIPSVENAAVEWIFFHNRTWPDPSKEADEWLWKNVRVTLQGWDYTLRPGRFKNSEWRSSYFGGRSDCAPFVVEIVPGLVDFPSSRDEIKANSRLDELVSFLRKAFLLDVPGSLSSMTAEFWKDLDDSYRRSFIDGMINRYPYKFDHLRELTQYWPETFKIFEDTSNRDDMESFYSIVMYKNDGLKLTDYALSNINYLDTTLGDDRKYKYRQYKMNSVKNSQLLLKGLELDAEVLRSFKDKERQLWNLDMNDLQYTVPGSQRDDIIAKADKWDYQAWRSVPVDYVLNSSQNSMYGMWRSNRGTAYIVQGDLTSLPAKARARALGKLRNYALLHMKETTGTRYGSALTFYLVDGVLSSSTLEKLKTRFESETAHNNQMKFGGVITYDDVIGKVQEDITSRRKANSSGAASSDVDHSRVTVLRNDTSIKPWERLSNVVQCINNGLSYNQFRWHGAKTIPVHTVSETIEASGVPDNAIIIFVKSCDTPYANWNRPVMCAILDKCPDWKDRPFYVVNNQDVRAEFVEECRSRNVTAFAINMNARFNNLKACTGYVEPITRNSKETKDVHLSLFRNHDGEEVRQAWAGMVYKALLEDSLFEAVLAPSDIEKPSGLTESDDSRYLRDLLVGDDGISRGVADFMRLAKKIHEIDGLSTESRELMEREWALLDKLSRIDTRNTNNLALYDLSDLGDRPFDDWMVMRMVNDYRVTNKPNLEEIMSKVKDSLTGRMVRDWWVGIKTTPMDAQ